MHGKLDITSYATLLRKCSDLDTGKQVHAEIVKNDLSHNTFLNNLLMQMYGRCGCPEQARHVFDKLDGKNTYSWTLMTLAYTQNGHMKDAVELYRQMGHEKQLVKPDSYTFSVILGALQEPGDLEQGKKLHADIVRSGWESDHVLATGLIGMYSRCGSLKEARGMFDKMERKDDVTWTTMVMAYVQNGHPLQALRLFKDMQDVVSPNMFTFSGAFAACSALGDLQQGKEIHGKMPFRFLESSIVVQNALVDMYGKCGGLEEARAVFDNMKNRDVVSWGSMISAYSRHNEPQQASEAMKLYRKMDLEGVEPDGFIFSSILTALASLCDLKQGRRVHTRLVACGGETLDVVTAAALVKMYTSCRCLNDARRVFDSVPTKDVVLWSNMISGYAQVGLTQEAMALYKRMVLQGEVQPDARIYACILESCCDDLEQGEAILSRVTVSDQDDETVQRGVLGMYLRCLGLEAGRKRYFTLTKANQKVATSTLIAEYVKTGHPNKALAIYGEMNELRPDAVTYACIIGACTTLGAMGQGKLVHDRIVCDGLDNTDLVLQNALLNMYTKCGHLQEAEVVFTGMFSRDAVSWTALMTGYVHKGFWDMSLEVFNEMNLEYVAPDGITFTALLHACSHLGLVQKSYEYFVSMKSDYGMEPLVEHYVGMVDVLARAGWIKEAEELVESMPFQPTEVAWTTVFGAYNFKAS